MNTLGLSEAAKSSVELRLSEARVLRVASLSGQAALKVFAWGDRRAWTNRDAVDLATLIEAYCDGSRLDEIYNTDRGIAVLAQYEYQIREAGARLLGEAIRADLGMVVTSALINLLVGEASDALAFDMALPGTRAHSLLDALIDGLAAST